MQTSRHPLPTVLLLLAALAASSLTPSSAPLAQAAKAPPAPAATPAAPVQPLPPVVAAIIDYNKVMRESKAAKGIRDQIEARRKSYQDQIAKEEQKLDGVQKELAKQRGVLSTEAFGKKRDDFQKQVLGVQRMVQERRRQLDQTQSAAYNQLRVATSDIIEELIDARGLTVVLDSRSVVAVNPEMDLTPELVRRLDEKLPNVKVPEKVAEKTGR
jgi:Skp family chaperone for outer membrane proteins